jgi:hypothetical protein
VVYKSGSEKDTLKVSVPSKDKSYLSAKISGTTLTLKALKKAKRTVKVTVSTQYASKKVSAKLTVKLYKSAVKLKKISLSKLSGVKNSSAWSLKKKKTYYVKVKASPSNSTNISSITFSVPKKWKKYISIEKSTGVLKTKKSTGKKTVTFTVKMGGKTLTKKVKVK